MWGAIRRGLRLVRYAWDAWNVCAQACRKQQVRHPSKSVKGLGVGVGYVPEGSAAQCQGTRPSRTTGCSPRLGVRHHLNYAPLVACGDAAVGPQVQLQAGGLEGVAQDGDDLGGVGTMGRG